MKMVTEFVFSHSTWMTNTIDEMLRGTERRKNKNKKRRTGQGRSLQTPANEEELVAVAELQSSANPDDEKVWGAGGADLKAEVGGVGGGDDAGRMRSGGMEEEEVDGGVGAVALTDLERGINASSGLHGLDALDTHVSVCKLCNQRLLGFAMAIHHHELHEDHEGGGRVRPGVGKHNINRDSF